MIQLVTCISLSLTGLIQGVQLVEKDNQCMAIDRVEPEQNLEAKHGDSSDDASKDNIVTVPTAKGGIRRKHHRAWTLAEVMRLVEGVSRYGAGRWSEIKRLAFASYSYRTSVDLKVFHALPLSGLKTRVLLFGSLKSRMCYLGQMEKLAEG